MIFTLPRLHFSLSPQTMKFTLAAVGLVAVAQVAYACENKQCAEDDQECISACVDQINKCVSDCGGGNDCYQQCISEWTPTITNSAGAPVSTSDPLGSATADISGYSTVTGVSAGPATAAASMSMNTAPGASSGAPLTGSAAASFASASASLATAFSSATMSLQSGFSASLSAASSSVAGAASSAASSSSSTSAASESASSSAKIIYAVCAVAALALAL